MKNKQHLTFNEAFNKLVHTDYKYALNMFRPEVTECRLVCIWTISLSNSKCTDTL